MAFEIIYGEPVRDLFAGIFDEVEKRVRSRARQLAHRLGNSDPGRPSLVKPNILGRFITSQ